MGSPASSETVAAPAPAPAPAPAAAMKKAAALPARGAVLSKAKAAKAKALPTRGVVKTTAKPKAVAAKEFAKVASTLKKSRSQGALPGSGTWYFMSDLRKMKGGIDDPKAWTKYNAKMNKQL